jgi:hypothetical protein
MTFDFAAHTYSVHGTTVVDGDTYTVDWSFSG